jgi:L-ribulose-5-phosphate 3-epimerase UlaE
MKIRIVIKAYKRRGRPRNDGITDPKLIRRLKGIKSGRPRKKPDPNAPIIIKLPKGRPRKEKISNRIRYSLTSHSVDSLFKKSQINIENFLTFCAANHMKAAELSAIHFPFYPMIPPDDYLFFIKEKAARLDIQIATISVKSDFTNGHEQIRLASVKMVKDWIVAANKMGVKCLQIVAGEAVEHHEARQVRMSFLVKYLHDCVDFGRRHQVVIALQNDNDFIKNADQAIEILKKVPSEWFRFCINLNGFQDINAYDEAKKILPYSIQWLIRETVIIKKKERKIKLLQLFRIIKGSSFKGIFQLEIPDNNEWEQHLNMIRSNIVEAIEKIENRKSKQ